MKEAGLSSQLTFVVEVVLNVGMEQEFETLMRQTTQSTRSEPGCLMYQWLRDRDDPRKLTLVESFRDDASLIAHGARLRELFGPPPQGRAQGLPERIVRCFESMAFRRVDALFNEVL